MKKTLQLVAILFCSFAGIQNGISQNSVSVNGADLWTGYANVFLTDGTTFQFGSGWGLADMKSVVNAGANTVTLYPNYNTYNAADPYWSNGAIGNKIFEGNTFVENNAFAGQVLTFTGNVTSNTLNSAYTAVAFIKGLNPATGYSTDVFVSAPLVAGQPFSITTDAAIPAGLVVQYGFTVKGLNANPAQEAALGNVVVAGNAVTPQEPLTAAPTPTRPAANVVSMFSNAYTNVTVDTWRTDWSNATLTDLQIAGNDTKKYSALSFVGVEATSSPINATAMTTFHLDAWTPNMTAFRVKLVDFGADGAFAGGDDVEHEITYVPTLNGWNSYEIPLADFGGLTTRGHIAQLIFSGLPDAAGVIYIDNVYFHNVPTSNPNEPMTAAPTPTRPAASVISMFSNAYTNVAVDTWRTVWSSANLTDLQIAGNDTKKYSALNFVGVETVNSQINATNMQYFHVDAWTPNMTTFRVKLVDFGANGVYQGTPNDDTEFELSYTPVLNQWNGYDIPLSSFTGLTSRAHIAQLIFSGNPAGAGTVFVDNVYFSNTPLASATFNLADVKMFPNPSSDVVTITAKKVIDSIAVYSVIGQEIKQINPNADSVVLDIADLQAGIYLVKVTADGATATSRLIKK
ncbi:MAG: T9SS type A sorting domain-containing protein [Flavobacterium sp.]|nr:T9SS type A sorting domain-containing protein [Flavobacterium sp.]